MLQEKLCIPKIREARDMLKSQGYILPPAGKVPKTYFNERVYKKESVE